MSENHLTNQSLKIKRKRAGELAALAEIPKLDSSTHMGAHDYL